MSRRSPLPIHEQLVDQLSHLIEERSWKAGSQLPTAQELAQFLGVNANTVRSAYRELVRRGYVLSEQGRGTFVSPDSPSTRGDHEKLRDLMDEVAVLGRRLGLSTDDVARLAFLRARLFTPETSRVRVLFVECSQWDVDFHLQTILEATGVRATGVRLKDLAGKRAAFFDDFDLLATTVFHAEEAQRIAGPARSFQVLMLEPSFEKVVSKLIPVKPNTRIAVVCTTKLNASKFVNALLARGLTHLRFSALGLDQKDGVEDVLAEAQEVWISRAVRSFRKAPWPKARPVHEYVDVLDETSLRRLRRAIAEILVKGSATAEPEPAAAVGRSRVQRLERLREKE